LFQKQINLQESMSIYVRIFGAVDITSRKMTISMETLDPSTGA